MALSTSPRKRTPHHVRSIVISSFDCEDGCVEIEVALRDEKRFDYHDRDRGLLAPGDFIHAINARVRIDESMTVLAVEADLEQVPFAFCSGGADNLPKLIGHRLDRGWRHMVNEALGSTRGCTHLRELLTHVPTVAFQTLSTRQETKMRAAGKSDADLKELPFYVNGCHSWNAYGPVVARYMPQFAGAHSKEPGDRSE